MARNLINLHQFAKMKPYCDIDGFGYKWLYAQSRNPEAIRRAGREGMYVMLQKKYFIDLDWVREHIDPVIKGK